jgi:hypothetical protein
MVALMIIGELILAIGQIWMAWEAYEQEGAFWGLLVLLVPFAGLYFWWQTDFKRELNFAGTTYLVGYLLSLVGRLTG